MNYLDNLDSLSIDNLSQICRTCSTQSNLQHLYNNIEIICMLEACTQLQFSKTEKLLPDKICTQCILNLKQSFEFINTCKKLDESLRKCINANKIDLIEHTIKKECDDYSETDQIDGNSFFEHYIKEEQLDNLCEETHEDNTNLSEEAHEDSTGFTIEEMHLKEEIDNNSDNTELEIDGLENLSDCMPPNIVEEAKEGTLNLLPAKSRKRYEIAYKHFMVWRKENHVKSFSEQVLLTYINQESKRVSPNSLWTIYSMLRSTLNIHQGIDIAQYLKLRAFLKRISVGYKPKKSKTLTTQEINKFLNDAPDDKYLLSKVILIVGISGACRKQELSQLKISNIEDFGSAAIINIPDTKTNKHRTFSITGKFYGIFKRYATLRPYTVNQPRFFLNYQLQKCTRQPVGINKIANIPKQIAAYLHLKEPELYTGHCFRRSSATMLMDAAADVTPIKSKVAAAAADNCTDESAISD